MSESGIGISNPLFFIGVIEHNIDPQLEGRVKVRAFSIHGDNRQVPTMDLPWALVVKGDYDPNGFIPPLNSFVYGMFLDGRAAQHPLVLGLIPTQFASPMNPSEQGWGVIPDCNGELVARGATPQDFGQPQNSRLARGENLEETYLVQQEMNRVEDVYIAGQSEVTDESERITWSEPNPAYGARYPHNRVIETAKHVIEIDDTPGAERIMIYHSEGSYIQIDARGTTTHKSVGDKYEINDRQHHVYIKGPSMVTIDNDAYVYVKGNKIEEIEGDYQMICRGNAIFGVGGALYLNASDQLQMRAADVMLDANVSTMSIFAKKELNIRSDIDINVSSKKMFTQQSQVSTLKSGGVIRFESEGGIFQEAKGGVGFNIKATGGDLKLQSDGDNVSIKAGDNVNVDPGGGIIDLANGSSTTAEPAEAPDAAVAEQTEMPEPPAKSCSVVSSEIASMNAPIALATDDDADPSHAQEGQNYFSNLGVAILEIDNLTVGTIYRIGGQDYELVESPTGIRYFGER
jgi:hypothetical protein